MQRLKFIFVWILLLISYATIIFGILNFFNFDFLYNKYDVVKYDINKKEQLKESPKYKYETTVKVYFKNEFGTLLNKKLNFISNIEKDFIYKKIVYENKLYVYKFSTSGITDNYIKDRVLLSIFFILTSILIIIGIHFTYLIIDNCNSYNNECKYCSLRTLGFCSNYKRFKEYTINMLNRKIKFYKFMGIKDKTFEKFEDKYSTCYGKPADYLNLKELKKIQKTL